MVQIQPGDPPAPTLSLAAGLALIEAVDVAVPAQALMLKWPNDLMLAGKKLGGILLERSGDRIAVGFGLNLASAPKLKDRQTATLGAQLTPEAFHRKFGAGPRLAGAGAFARHAADGPRRQRRDGQRPLRRSRSGRSAALDHGRWLDRGRARWRRPVVNAAARR